MEAKILVVDDELLLRDVLYDFLTRKGYSVLLAADGNKALEILKEKKIHIALVDIKMPGMNGLELSKKMREDYPNVSIIIMTGYPSLNSAVTAIKNGAKEYIVKPFRLDEIDRIIKKNLDTMGMEIENLKLKERIRELEDRLSPEEVKKEFSEQNKEPMIDLPRQSFRISKTNDSKETNQVVGKNIYKAKSLNEKEKETQQNLKKIEDLYLEGLLDEKEYKKKRDDLLNTKYAKKN